MSPNGEILQCFEFLPRHDSITKIEYCILLHVLSYLLLISSAERGILKCYQIFVKLLIKNELLLIKIIKKIIYGEAFYWFVLLTKLINY